MRFLAMAALTAVALCMACGQQQTPAVDSTLVVTPQLDTTQVVTPPVDTTLVVTPVDTNLVVDSTAVVPTTTTTTTTTTGGN